jgi:hypothetical protein
MDQNYEEPESSWMYNVFWWILRPWSWKVHVWGGGVGKYGLILPIRTSSSNSLIARLASMVQPVRVNAGTVKLSS